MCACCQIIQITQYVKLQVQWYINESNTRESYAREDHSLPDVWLSFLKNMYLILHKTFLEPDMLITLDKWAC